MPNERHELIGDMANAIAAAHESARDPLDDFSDDDDNETDPNIDNYFGLPHLSVAHHGGLPEGSEGTEQSSELPTAPLPTAEQARTRNASPHGGLPEGPEGTEGSPQLPAARLHSAKQARDTYLTTPPMSSPVIDPADAVAGCKSSYSGGF